MHQLGSKEKWKAFDFEVFLLYGFVSLRGILNSAYYNNFRTLAVIISTLNKRNITLVNDIEPCKQLITTFLEEYSQLYPNKTHRYNVHCLMHLPEVVLQFGPLITNSAFCVENSMGIYVRKVETATAVPQQTIKKSVVTSSMIAMASTAESGLSTAVREFAAEVIPKLNELSQRSQTILRRPRPDDTLTERHKTALDQYVDHFDTAKFYGRLIYNNFTITTFFPNHIQTANYYLKANNCFFRIVKIIHFPLLDEVCLLGFKYDLVNSDDFNDFHYVYTASIRSSSIEIVRLHQIQALCSAYYDTEQLYFFEIANRHT